MNKSRRKRLEAIRDAIEIITWEELAAQDRLPASLRHGPQGDRLQAIRLSLDEARRHLRDAME